MMGLVGIAGVAAHCRWCALHLPSPSVRCCGASAWMPVARAANSRRFRRLRRRRWCKPMALLGFAAPGTFTLAMVFLVSFVLYYFINWKYLSQVWGLS